MASRLLFMIACLLIAAEISSARADAGTPSSLETVRALAMKQQKFISKNHQVIESLEKLEKVWAAINFDKSERQEKWKALNAQEQRAFIVAQAHEDEGAVIRRISEACPSIGMLESSGEFFLDSGFKPEDHGKQWPVSQINPFLADYRSRILDCDQASILFLFDKYRCYLKFDYARDGNIVRVYAPECSDDRIAAEKARVACIGDGLFNSNLMEKWFVEGKVPSEKDLPGLWYAVALNNHLDCAGLSENKEFIQIHFQVQTAGNFLVTEQFYDKNDQRQDIDISTRYKLEPKDLALASHWTEQPLACRLSTFNANFMVCHNANIGYVLLAHEQLKRSSGSGVFKRGLEIEP